MRPVNCVHGGPQPAAAAAAAVAAYFLRERARDKQEEGDGETASSEVGLAAVAPFLRTWRCPVSSPAPARTTTICVSAREERPLAARACESTRIYRAAAAALRLPPRALEKGEVPRKGGA